MAQLQATGITGSLNITGSVIVSGSVTASAFSGEIGTLTYFQGAPQTEYPSSTWLPCDGAVYLQSSYPELYSKIGKLANGKPGENWTTRTMPNGAYQAVGYGNGLFVALTNGVNYATSPDGITWTARSNMPTGDWKAIAYGNDIWVATGNGPTNRLATSTNGTSWTARTPPAVRDWWGLHFADGKFVAVGTQGATDNIMTSTNGIDWTLRTGPSDLQCLDVTYYNGRWVGVTYGRPTMFSDDTINWQITSASLGAELFRCAAGNGVFVAPWANGQNKIEVSKDGVTWETVTWYESIPSRYTDVVFVEGYFVAVGDNVLGAAVSRTGYDWKQVATSVDESWEGITYGNGTVVAVSITTSTNGMTSLAYTYNPTTEFATPTQDQTTIIGLDAGAKLYIRGK
jgi:microcystin-dependent protein